MATTFTTWTDLYTALLNKLAARDFSKSSAEIPGGGKVTWASADEFLRILEYAKVQANLEGGAATFRTYAKDGGRG